MSKHKPPRIVIVIKRGMVESVHVGKRSKHVEVIVLDKDNDCGGLEDPELAQDHYTERLVEVGTTEAVQPIFTRYFEHCGVQWEDDWSCACNDECPKCGGEIEPYKYTVHDAAPGECPT